MLHYLHCYKPESWEAQVRRGLVREVDGIRFASCFSVRPEHRFNTLAAKGGALYRLLEERRCPFYIDRLQGGVNYWDYEFDRGLLAEYERLLGDNFLGFQLHEYFSNYNSDLKKLTELSDDRWTVEEIERTVRGKFPMSPLFLEAMSAEEMASFGRPYTPREFYRNTTEIYRRRQAVWGKLVPCDSSSLAFAYEIAHGAKVIMAEVGAQTHNTKLQLCYAGGMAKAHGISFGVYYEPWGGSPFSACCYERGQGNEWDLTAETGFPFETAGPNGGSSRSLQWREHLYAYLSGASYISEEWGLCNTFTDWRDFELSEYGLVKKRFLDFVDRYPDLGEKLAPVAMVLPAELPILIERDRPGRYFDRPLDEGQARSMKRIWDGIHTILPMPDAAAGYEARPFANSPIPDGVDLLNECSEAALSPYAYLVDLTCRSDFARTHSNCIAPEEVPAVLERLFPCRVEGGLHHVVNRRGKDGYYLTVFNHAGILRSVAEGERRDPEAARRVTITLSDAMRGRELTVLEGDARVEYAEGRCYATLPAGGWLFAKF